MILFDSAATRKAFFLTYLIGTLPLFISMIHGMQENMFKNDTFHLECETLKKQGKFAEFEVSNMTECQAKMGVYSNTFIIMCIMGWFVFVEYWWFCTLYTHYKNYAKEQSGKHQL